VEKIINFRGPQDEENILLSLGRVGSEQILSFMHLFDSVEYELYGSVFHVKLVEVTKLHCEMLTNPLHDYSFSGSCLC
jgi:hypothetical protein